MADLGTKYDEYGGCAFPFTAQGPGGETTEADPGMTLRDWFAGKALGEATRDIHSDHKPEDVAKRCYDLADALLKQRDR